MATNPESFPATGGCVCGKVRYRLETAPIFTNCCHCTWCQRETGSTCAVNATIEASRVTLLPPQDDSSASPVHPLKVPLPSLSGKGQTCYRCPSCFVTLWSTYGAAPQSIYFIRVGTLDDSSIIKPDVNIFTSTRLPWVELCPDIPAAEERYRSHSKEAMERMSAAIKASKM
jgi:hypothetical protein